MLVTFALVVVDLLGLFYLFCSGLRWLRCWLVALFVIYYWFFVCYGGCIVDLLLITDYWFDLPGGLVGFAPFDVCFGFVCEFGFGFIGF